MKSALLDLLMTLLALHISASSNAYRVQRLVLVVLLWWWKLRSGGIGQISAMQRLVQDIDVTDLSVSPD